MIISLQIIWRFIPLGCVSMICNCSPDPVPVKIDLTCAGRLVAKDLTEVNNCLEGNWKIIYTKNDAGQKQLLTNSFMRMTSDSVFYYSEGDIIAESSFTLSADPDPSISFTNWQDENFNWKIERISNDSLFFIADGTKRIVMTRSELQPVVSCERFFWEKSLHQIKHCLYGKWQLQYRYGGFSGNEKTYYRTEYTLDFRKSDSLYYITNGTISGRRKVKWIKGVNILGYETYMFAHDGDEFQIIRGVEQIRQDTLVLYDNVSDGYGYYLSRRY